MNYKATLALAAALLGVGTLALSPAVAGPGLSVRSMILYPIPPLPPGPCIQCNRLSVTPGGIVVNPQVPSNKVMTGTPFSR